MKTFTRSPILTLAALLAALAPVPALARPGPRIKDIVDVQNVRPNQLVGYGLVVGLQDRKSVV